ncbi:Cell wall synthesis protein KRE9 precursor [Scheffersomyces stipitis CBS 6054]|uniref:Cell wall synthesis protein KRE9 n=1 Tax=Scheffersomyces stipitis (strain ATCC 58785 / CBS 6054 / NBRC 10063 / NRRL Y-11545) TaxID=322104 RepID=A3LPU0_PICST|nr:Cell wall synthesis protein KRE9 precursor [Scheffersomyces stipitis CBS 6054]ABN64556.2 Cell wall synthesis protein KRE9 precursor [Scheffersomyces stipitis CBS 6054]
MHIIFTLASWFLTSTLFYSLASADVDITAPKQGDSFSGSGGSASFKVSWDDDSSDSSDEFSLSNVKYYTILLCTNTNTEIGCDDKNPLVFQLPLSSKSTTVTVPASNYPNGYYYVQIYTTFKSGSTTAHYSNRFHLTSMSGTSIASIIYTITGAGPAADTSDIDGGSTTYASSLFTIPYTMQTSTKRFAPMQTQPGSKVTATTWSIKYPTSAVTYYTTKGPKPVVMSTITPGWDYTPTSLPNAASVAPYPSYFYPASDRVSKATLSAATKRRRWLDLD